MARSLAILLRVPGVKGDSGTVRPVGEREVIPVFLACGDEANTCFGGEMLLSERSAVSSFSGELRSKKKPRAGTPGVSSERGGV